MPPSYLFYCADRGIKHPEQHLANYAGRSRPARQPPIAVEAVECICALFAIERAIKGPDAAGAAARTMSALEARLREQRARVSGQSKIGQAMLTRFLKDCIGMSNNAGKNWTFAGL